MNPENNLVVVFVSNLSDEKSAYPEGLYLEYILPAIQGPPLASDGTAEAAYSNGQGLFQMDLLPDETAPAGADVWSGVYNLGENAFGLKGIGLEISPDGTPISITQIYESHSEVYILGMPTEYAVTILGEKDTALRAAWNARGQLEILYMGVGEAWWTRLRIVVSEGIATIRVQTSSGDEAWLRGVRAPD